MAAARAKVMPAGDDPPRLDGYLKTLDEVYRKVTGRAPTAFEVTTARSLFDAFVAASDNSGPVSFQVVSAPTGGGKTIGALALLAYLHPRPSCFITRTIEEVNAILEQLLRVLPAGSVAAFSTLHRVGADRRTVAEKERELGIKLAGQYTESRFAAAPVVVATHERWRREHTEGRDLGVRRCAGHDRAVIIVDEDPEVERTHVRQPEDVSALLSLLTDTPTKEEARAYRFTTSHHAATTLGAVHDRMRALKDNATLPVLSSNAGLILPDEAEAIRGLSSDDVRRRARLLADRGGLPGNLLQKTDEALETLSFLHAVCDGMAFYSKDATGAGAFHGYRTAVPPERRTLILDGTSELNGLYGMSSGMRIVRGPEPSYEAVEIYYVLPPTEFEGRMKPTGILRTSWSAKPYMEWLRTFLLTHIRPGERVLVYGKKQLIAYGLHKELGDGIESPLETRLDSREIHFVNFGRGRGSNRWKDFDVYVQLGDFHQKKAVLVSKIGSIRSRVFSSAELDTLSSGTTRHADYLTTREGHLAITAKQDASRIRIRNLGDDGRAPAARLYFVDTDLGLLQRMQPTMFPGSKAIELITYSTGDEGATGRSKIDQLRNLLLRSNRTVLTAQEVAEETGVRSNMIDHALGRPEVAAAMSLRGWYRTTRRQVGLSRKGWCLVRPDESSRPV
jgi:hypothetical protein